MSNAPSLLRGALVTVVAWLACLSARAATTPDQVVIKDFLFVPTLLTVKAGTTVTWANTDEEPHTVVSDTGLFRSSAIDAGEAFSFRFVQPGTYHFLCTIHPRMVGTIVVE